MFNTKYCPFARCPYCGRCRQDYHTYMGSDGETKQMECANCGKEFKFKTHITVEFSSWKEDSHV